MAFSTKIYENWRDIQNEKFDQLVNVLRRMKGRILDLGCGSGFLEEFLEMYKIKKDIIGLDTDIEMLSKAHGFPRIVADGNLLPLKSGQFDVIICADAAHFIKNINEMERIFKSKGRLLVLANYNKREDVLKRLSAFFVLEEAKVLPGREKEIFYSFSHDFG